MTSYDVSERLKKFGLLTFKKRGWTFQFLHTLNVKHEYHIKQERENYEIHSILEEKITQILQHILKMQYISMLPKYINQVVCVFLHTQPAYRTLVS